MTQYTKVDVKDAQGNIICTEVVDSRGAVVERIFKKMTSVKGGDDVAIAEAKKEGRVELHKVETVSTVRKVDKTELQSKVDAEVALYKARTTGFHDDLNAAWLPHLNSQPRKHYVGAIEEVLEQSTSVAVAKVAAMLDQGYKFCTSGYLPSIEKAMTKFYVVKPESLQAEDIKLIAAQVEADYKAEIDAYNEKVFEQEAQALREEEARVAAQLKAEDEAKSEAEFEKRVRARMKGAK
ncbi:hypothetical protein ACIPZ5_17750 [Pseudomonas sp. NPDC089428]|uniref:hypothetical protein n=1 Tax=Pseudomonas sp. NPDC089428 TaxID=3364467 RepID=UPI00382D99BE